MIKNKIKRAKRKFKQKAESERARVMNGYGPHNLHKSEWEKVKKQEA
jgi:hypothetical protein